MASLLGRVLRGDGKKADDLLSKIIRDFHGRDWTPESHMSLANAAPFDLLTDPLATPRVKQFLVPTNQNSHRVHRFIFLGILSLSPTFINELKTVRCSVWDLLMERLDSHEETITFYMRARLAPWREVLIAYFDKIGDLTGDSPPFRTQTMPAGAPFPPLGLDDNFFQNQPNTHPDIFYLTATGTARLNIVVSGRHAHQPMENVTECSYTRTHWPAAAPALWPAHRTYRDHPQNVRDCHGGVGGANAFLMCAKCDRDFRAIGGGVVGCGCKCTKWCAQSMVQVKELAPYPAAPQSLNKGVIAVERIAVGEVLGEYTGELLPPGKTDSTVLGNPHADDIYAMDIHAHGVVLERRRRVIELGPNIGQLSAAWKGSWARFINTAPLKAQWNVEFDQLLVEDRVRIVVRAIKEIKIGDEILVPYGDPYMKDLFGAAWKA